MDLNEADELERKLTSQKPKNVFNKDAIDKTDFNSKISQLVTEGKLPNNEASLAMIREGLIDLDTAQQRYQQSLQNKVVTNQQGQVNKPTDLQNIAQNDLRGVEDVVKKGAEQQRWWDAAYTGTKDWLKKQKTNFSSMGSQLNEALDPNKGGIDAVKFATNFFRLTPYKKQVLKKGLSGLTMGVSEASDTLAPNQSSGNAGVDAAGTLMELSGGLLITALTGGQNFVSKKIGEKLATKITERAALKQLGITAKAAGNIPAAKEVGALAFKTGVQKAGLSMAKTAAEAAPIGLATGFAKGTIESAKEYSETGEVDWANPLVSALEEGLAFSVLGAALDPVVTVGSKLLGTSFKPLASEAEQARGKRVGPLFGNKQQARADLAQAKIASNPAAQQLASKEAQTTDIFKTLIDQEKAGTISEQGLKALNAKRRLDAIAPNIAPELKLLSSPEFMQQAGKEELSRIGKQIFDDPIYATIMESNPAMSKLVQEGQWDKAIYSLRDNLVKTVKTSDSLLEYLQTAYITDVADLNKIVARRVQQRAANKYPELNEGLIKDYLDDPSEANKIALKEASSPNIFRTLKSKKLLDTRLNAVEANMVVDDLLTKKFEAIQGKVDFKNLPDLADLDNITKSAMTFNKLLYKTLLKAYSEKANSNLVMFDDKELLPAVQAKMKALNVQDDLLLIANKKSKINLQIGEIQDQMLRGGVDKATGTEQIKNLKADLVSLSQKSSSRLGDLRKFEGELTGLTQDQVTKVDSFVNKVYRPAGGATQLPVQTRDVKNIYGADANPYFLMKDSGLADTLDAFTVNGLDTKISNKSIGLDMFKNVWSKWADEFGARGEAFKAFGEKVQQANTNVINDEKIIFQKLKATDIKTGSKDSALLQRYVEDTAFKTSNEWLALPEATRYKVQSAAPVISSIYDDLLTRINTKMEQLNLPLIEERKNYVTHFQEVQSIWSEVLDHAISGNSMDDLMKRLPGIDPSTVRFVTKDNKSYFQFAKKRTGAEFTEDAIGAMTKYVKPALKRIHMSDLIREVDVAKNFAPKNFQDTLTRFKEDYLLDKASVFNTETESGVRNTLGWVRDRMAKGAILYNVNSLINQATSAPLSFAISGPEAVHATRMRFTKDGKEAIALSRNLAQRNIQNLNELDNRMVKGVMDKYIPDIIKNPVMGIKGFVKEFGEKAIETFDKEAATHAYLTGFMKARKAGLADKEAAMFADKMVDYIHADISKLGRSDSKFLQSDFGKSIAQFQSFSINLASTIATELPRMARTEGASAAVTSLLRAAAAVEIVNAAARNNNLPEPYDMTTIMPFVSAFKYGVPGALGLGGNIYASFVDDRYHDKIAEVIAEPSVEGFKKVLPWKKALTLGVTGGGQLVKGIDAVDKLLNDEYENMYDFIKDFSFGPKRVEKALKKQDEDLSWFKKQKLKRKDAIRNKFGLGKKYEFDYAD